MICHQEDYNLTEKDTLFNIYLLRKKSVKLRKINVQTISNGQMTPNQVMYVKCVFDSMCHLLQREIYFSNEDKECFYINYMVKTGFIQAIHKTPLSLYFS